MSMKPVIRYAGEGKMVTMKGQPLTFLVTEEATKHTSMFEWKIPPGFATGLHVHKVQEETFYVLDGQCEWFIDGKQIQASRGTFVFIPPGVPHNITNASASPATVLMTVSPPGHEHYFEELSTILESGTPPDPLTIQELRARYDTQQLSALSTDVKPH